MEESAILDAFRSICALLDRIVYSLIANAYNLIEDVTHYKFLENFSDITDKVYMILSIFMLFKVSFSFVNYLVNPDSFTDKEKGVQKIVVNVVIMFILLVISPWAFKQMWNLQDALLKENVLGQFVFGDEESTELNQYIMWDICGEESLSTANSTGDYIAIMSLRAFYKPYTKEELGGYSITDSDFSDALEGGSICGSRDQTTPSMYLSSSIYNAKLDDGVFNWFFGMGDEDIYVMNYMVIVSTAVGIVILLILINFAMDVGVRLIKLSFLELIAPVPIVSYVEPSSSKNGMFMKWLKEVGATWVSVFIRLFALFFAVRIIQEVGSTELLTPISDEYGDANGWVVLIVIIGALMFAKQLPKLISDITGIKLDGGFNLNPLKKIENEALGGKQLLGAGAAGVAAGMGGVANLAHRLSDKNTWKDGKLRGLGRTAGSALAGATSAGYRTFGKVSKDGNVFGGIKNGHLEAMFAKQQREDLTRKGSTFGGRFRADANRWIGRMNKAQQNELKFANAEAQIKADENRLSQIESNLKRQKEAKSDGYKEYFDLVSSMNNKINAQVSVKEAQSMVDAVKQNAAYIENGELNADGKAALENAMKNLTAARKAEMKNHINDADMVEWQKRLKYLAENNSNIKGKIADGKLNATGIKSDGTIDIGAMWAADSELKAVQTRYVQDEQNIAIEKEKIAIRKEELANRKTEERVIRAEADNASRSIKEPQPQGWKPSADINAGSATGYGPNEYYDGSGFPPPRS